MRILRVSSSLYPEKVGGIGVHVHEMSRLQGAQGHEVIVLTSDNGDETLPRREERDQYTVIRHRELIRPADNSIIPGICRTLWRNLEEYDVIHAHSYLFFSTNIAAILSRITNTPLALTHHGMYPSSAPSSLERVYIPTVGKFTFNSAEKIFCYTDSAVRALRDLNVKPTLRTIHNGVDCSEFSPTGGRPDGGSPDGRQLLFVGRLKAGKGVEVLLEAFEELENQYPELRLKIVGDGQLRRELEREYADERITFTGQVAYDEMPQLYRESTVLILPTKTEATIPRVVMEAWACETPIVMTDVPRANTEHVEAGGIAITDRAAETVSSAVRELLEDEEKRTRKGQRGREIVKEHYSWRETVRQTTTELRRIVES